jgi:hypothetical protein
VFNAALARPLTLVFEVFSNLHFKVCHDNTQWHMANTSQGAQNSTIAAVSSTQADMAKSGL